MQQTHIPFSDEIHGGPKDTRSEAGQASAGLPVSNNLPAKYRLLHLDWLRLLAMASVFVFHSGRAFDELPWHVKNDELSSAFTILTIVLAQWIMPIFFVISGWTSFLVLQSRSVRVFMISRTKRLMVPLVFGVFIFAPPQVFVERKTQTGVSEGFLQWLPAYFDGFYGFGGNFAWMGLHLWYLLVLFLINIVTLPIMVAFRRPGAAIRVNPATVILLGALPIFASELFVVQFPETIGRQDFGGWSPITYVVWFLLGYSVGRSRNLQDALVAGRHLALGIVVTGLVAGSVLVMADGVDFGFLGNTLVRTCVAWGGVAAAFGFSAIHLNRNHVWLGTLNRYLLPFYILHQTVIVLVVYLLSPMDASALVKFGLTAFLSLAVIIGAIAVLIRPSAILHPAFGLSRPGKKFAIES